MCEYRDSVSVLLLQASIAMEPAAMIRSTLYSQNLRLGLNWSELTQTGRREIGEREEREQESLSRRDEGRGAGGCGAA